MLSLKKRAVDCQHCNQGPRTMFIFRMFLNASHKVTRRKRAYLKHVPLGKCSRHPNSLGSIASLMRHAFRAVGYIFSAMAMSPETPA
jgi:hypothetical protein